MMRNILALLITLQLLNTVAEGHGIPISVSVDASNKLTVTNTQPLYSSSDLETGYAQMILLDNEDAAVMDHITINSSALNLHGKFAFTTLPGFNVTGVTPNSGLYLQVIPRPIKGSDPVSGRLLWHSSVSPTGGSQPTNSVMTDPADESLVIASDPDSTVQQISVPQSDGNPLSLKFADPAAAELGTHQHYLEYLLGDPPAQTGLYGFFARVTSPSYGASDPFLIILNNGVYEDDYPGQVLAGALAINNAAILAGDYNHDDKVDAADYVVWRNSVGSTTSLRADGSGNQLVDQSDYQIWRANFGNFYKPNVLSGSSVPEASLTGNLITFLFACFALRRAPSRFF